MGTSTGARVPLSRDRIVEAALAVVGEDGFEALSMRRLAQALDCGPMSLYTHVADKAEVRRLLVERVLADLPLPDPGTPWRAAVTTIAHDLRALFDRHPWLTGLWWTRPGPHRTALMEALLGAFRRGGFSARLAHHGFHAVDLHVVGHARTSVDLAAKGRDSQLSLEERARRFLERTPADAYPHVVEHVELHTLHGAEDSFTFLLDLLLDGLAQHLGED